MQRIRLELTLCFSLGLFPILPQTMFAQDFEIIGHRGASRDAPENTLASINLAWKRNADAVEIDIYLTKDGKIVVVHDATTKRYGGPDVKIENQTFDELRKLDVGTWKSPRFRGEKIPTLDEVLQTIPQGKRLFIELKSDRNIVPELKRILDSSKKKPNQTVIIGFSLEAVTAAKRQLPNRKVFWIVRVKQSKRTKEWQPGLPEMIAEVKKANLDGLDLGHAPIFDRDYITKVKRAGLGFFVWTVDDAKVARKLKQNGVDGITTNRPGWLKRKIERKSH